MTKEQALLLDVSYFDESEKSIISLFVLNEKENFWLKDENFKPYLYVATSMTEKEKTIKELKEYIFGTEERFKIANVIDTKNKNNGKEILKIEFNRVAHLVQARKYLAELGFERYEYDVPFAKRYLLDKALQPGNWIEYDVFCEEKIKTQVKVENEKNNAKNDEDSEEDVVQIKGKVKIINSIKVIDAPFIGRAMAFDLETYSGKKFGIGLEPILMTSVVAGELGSEKKANYQRVASYNTKKVNGLQILENEKELIEKLIEDLSKKDNSFIVTYNGDNFDFAYTKERAKKYKIDFRINGYEPRTMRHGLDNAVKLQGIQHIDSYQIMKFLQRTGAVNTVKLDIESVSEKVFGEYKEKVIQKKLMKPGKKKTKRN